MGNKKFLRYPGIIVYTLSVLLGILLTGVAAWGDLEAVFYGFDTIGGKPLKSLRCPVIMSSNETGTISLKVKNPSDREVSPLLRADISSPGPFQQTKTRLPLAPGETKEHEWIVTQENVDLGYFILAKVFTYASGPLPFREATCGILVVDLPGLTGNQFLVTWIVIVVVGITAGLLLWQAGSKPLMGRTLSTAWALRLLAGVILLGVISSLLGWLLISILVLALSVLFTSVFIFMIVNR